MLRELILRELWAGLEPAPTKFTNREIGFEHGQTD